MARVMVYPLKREDARRLCEQHPHAQSLPNSTKLCLGGYIDGRLIGLAAWGYGIKPSLTPRHMFGPTSSVADYLELCRFFVYDSAPKNSASAFLAATHKIVRKYIPGVEWLYTYAAGFQGMVGTIYQASNYLYIGKQTASSFIYVPDVGLIHAMSLFHRYAITGDLLNAASKLFGRRVFKWVGPNYRYIYFLCKPDRVNALMDTARFTVQPYPSLIDIEVYIVDNTGRRIPMSTADAKQIPIVRLPTRRLKDSSEPLDILSREGGATPTQPLQSLSVKL